MNETRICRVCKTEKNIKEFNFKNKLKGTRQRRCKHCDKVFADNWYKNNKQRRIEQVKARKIIVKKQLKEYIKSVKEKGCELCGYDRCVDAIDFHHIDSFKKEIGISKAITQCWSLERLKKEIAKCKVVCSNCHREIHNDFIKI